MAAGGVGVDPKVLGKVGRVNTFGLCDGEEKCNGAVATIGGLSLKGVLTTGSIGVAIPNIAAGGGIGKGVVDAAINGKVEDDDAVAPVRITGGV